MRILSTTLVLLVATACSGGVIVLKDGTRLEGDVKRTSEGWTITLTDGTVKKVSTEAVRSIELGSAPRSSDQSAAGLASLRRSIDALNDIDQIIERYQKFIDATKDEKVKADAQSDLAEWMDRKSRGLIKHGTKWISPDEVQAIAARATEVALEARELIRQNRNKEADAILQKALAEDPMNPAAHYLRGVALYRMDKTVDARKAFEAVNSVVPDHPPTLNNLAVILHRQNAVAAAMNWYDLAMQSSGVNKFILDNVAEALGTLKEDQLKAPSIAKCHRRFIELDVILQRQLEPQGLFRWGGGWVTQQQLDQLRVAEKDIRDKLGTLQQEFDQTKARIAQIDDEIRQNNISMQEIASTRYFRDKDGNYIQLPMPQIYYDLQAQNTRLKSEQDTLKAKITQMQEQARRIQQQVPVPRFTGVQQIVGVEGMPGSPDVPVAPPTTSPGELPPISPGE